MIDLQTHILDLREMHGVSIESRRSTKGMNCPHCDRLNRDMKVYDGQVIYQCRHCGHLFYCETVLGTFGEECHTRFAYRLGQNDEIERVQ